MQENKHSRINRRDFLRRVGLLGSATMISPYIMAQNNDIDCLVLGAGMAGITAARHITDSGLNVKLLEGSDRIGGRIYSVKDGIELGAELVHRKGEVLLWSEIDKYGLDYSTPITRKTSYVYNPNFTGNKLLSSTLAAEQWTKAQAAGVFKKLNEITGSRDISGREALKMWTHKMAPDFVTMILNGGAPASLEEISMFGFSSDKLSEQLREKYTYAIYGGYGALLKKMTAGLDIETDERVQRISYGNDGVVVNTDNHEYKARAVVCSFSIGMLKSGNVEFIPELPKEKIDALQNIKMGPQSKIVVGFEEDFWPEGPTIISNANQNRRAGLSYYKSIAGNNMIVMSLSGEDAEKFRGKSNEEFLIVACEDLDEILSKEPGTTFKLVSRNEDEDSGIYRKDWAEDIFSLGGNSYLALNEERSRDIVLERMRLADARTTPRLFWAGEGVALSTQPLSVHGAYASGRRASKEVIEYLTKNIILNPRDSAERVGSDNKNYVREVIRKIREEERG